DLLAEQVDTAGEQLGAAERHAAALARQLEQARSERETARNEREDAERRLRGMDGYGAQASFDALLHQDREQLDRLKRELQRPLSVVCAALDQLATAALPGVDAGQLDAARTRWRWLFDAFSALPRDAALPW